MGNPGWQNTAHKDSKPTNNSKRSTLQVITPARLAAPAQKKWIAQKSDPSLCIDNQLIL
jgi:hypothetical protein